MSKENQDPVLKDMLDKDPELRKRWEENVDRRAFANVMLRLRGAADMKQEDLARALDLQTEDIQRLEGITGEFNETDNENAQKVADYCINRAIANRTLRP